MGFFCHLAPDLRQHKSTKNQQNSSGDALGFVACEQPLKLNECLCHKEVAFYEHYSSWGGRAQ